MVLVPTGVKSCYSPCKLFEAYGAHVTVFSLSSELVVFSYEITLYQLEHLLFARLTHARDDPSHVHRWISQQMSEHLPLDVACKPLVFR